MDESHGRADAGAVRICMYFGERANRYEVKATSAKGTGLSKKLAVWLGAKDEGSSRIGTQDWAAAECMNAQIVRIDKIDRAL